MSFRISVVSYRLFLLLKYNLDTEVDRRTLQNGSEKTMTYHMSPICFVAARRGRAHDLDRSVWGNGATHSI